MSAASMSPASMGSSGSGSNVTEIELMRTILGEHVPQSVILACLNACGFDVAAALNWYFIEVATQEAEQERHAHAHAAAGARAAAPAAAAPVDMRQSPIIQSGLSLTLHSRNVLGMISKTDSYYATLTRGIQSYDMLTPSNEKFLTIKLRKRGWRPTTRSGYPHASHTAQLAQTMQRPYFMNGDIVTLECNGLWLKTSSLHKMLQWKSPSDDDRCKFVIRGLPLGRNLRPGDYFFLTSYKFEDKEIVMKEEKPVGLTSYNTSVHRCFLGLDRVKWPQNRLYFYAKLTENAIASLQQPNDPIDIQQLSIDVVGTPALPTFAEEEMLSPQRRPFSSEIAQMDAKIDQMVGIVGEDIPRDRLVNFLDGAGGNVQIALEHYFMTLSVVDPVSTTLSQPPSVRTDTVPPPPVQVPAPSTPHHRRPLSDLIIPIPSIAEPLQSPTPNGSVPTTTAQFHADDEAVQAALDSALMSSSRDRSHRGISTDSIHLEGSGYSQDEEPEGLTIHDFEMVSVLGKGSFGAVMLVRFKQDGRVFALKIIKKANMDKSDIRNAMEERQILQRIHHPYICSLMFAFQTNERLYLGMKYYAAGDLFYHLNMRGQLPVRDAQLYAAELVLAISYLHDLNILYRDLKPSNVMIDAEGHIGVVDFGLSKQHIYGSNHGVKTLSGTAEYVAPEALAQMADGSRSYGKAYDWWSLGVVIYEMLVGESPFYDKNEHKMLRKIAYADVIFPSDFPREALELVRGLLIKDPSRRLGSERLGGVDRIKQDRFFRGIDWDLLARREIPAYWKPKLSSETDTRYVDPEFIDEGPPSAVMDPSASDKKSFSKRFSQFSFNINLS